MAGDAVFQSEKPLHAAALVPLARQLPPGACDTHCHVFGPTPQYPKAGDARYTCPPEADWRDYQRMANALGLQRCVLVQSSYYGSDNRYLLEALKAGAGALRGVAMYQDEGARPPVHAWHALGVRGLRLDLFRALKQGKSADDVRATLDRAATLANEVGWSLDLYAPGSLLLALAPHLRDLPVSVSVAHLGYLTEHEGLTDDDCERFVRTVSLAPNVFVKLTGAYRYGGCTTRPFLLARMLLDFMPQRLLWGSDWPHVMAKPQDAARMLNELFDACCSSAQLIDQILVSAPERLYGFHESA